MSGPRMGNLGQMNGNRRPNISRMNYHDRQSSSSSSSYQEHRQYQDHRNSYDGTRHDRYRPHEHRSYDSRPHDNRQYHHHQPMPPMTGHAQHDELIKFIHESWSKVEMDKASNNVLYYQEHENSHLKDFRPFDLEAYWGRKVHQNHQQHQS